MAASAFKSGSSWIVKFTGLHMTGGKCRQFRVHIEDVPDPARLARRCFEVCRQLEAGATEKLIAEALEVRAITDDEAARLRGEEASAGKPTRHPHSIMQLALSHPSTYREESHPTQYDRHCRELEAFLQWAGISRAHELSLDLVMRYIKHLEGQGYEPDGIRHKLLWLRRASRMAGSLGLPDPISGFILQRRQPIRRRGSDLKVWSIEQLVQAIKTLEGHGDLRAAAAIALGGLMGLRSSEIRRARIADLKDGVLEVGAVEAKNQSSNRFLPVPEPVLSTLTALIALEARKDAFIGAKARQKGRDFVPSPFLVRSDSRRNTEMRAFSDSGFWKWLQPTLKEQTGVALPAKNLRKSFSTWLRDSLPVGKRDLMEAWLGHRTSLALPVTSRHYLADVQVEQLRPVAEIVEKTVAATMSRLRSARIIDATN